MVAFGPFFLGHDKFPNYRGDVQNHRRLFSSNGTAFSKQVDDHYDAEAASENEAEILSYRFAMVVALANGWIDSETVSQ